tara:strand:+ start:2200 stop:3408 length:1209 start_codon:yes stop_codon:yes gene_type:complete
MKLIDRFKAAIVRSLSLREPDGWTGGGRASDAGEIVTEGSVLALSAVWACTNLLSGTISSLPLMVYREEDGKREAAKDHALYRILHDSPNFDQTAVDFWDFMSASIELWGNAYAEITRTNGKVVGLSPVNPDLMTVRRLQNGSLEYRWTQDGRQRELTDKDILHIRGFGGAPLGGMSTLHFGRNSFGLAKAIDRSASTTFANGMRPSGALTFDAFLSPENRKIARTNLVEEYVGAVNAGKPLILEGGTKWQQLTINPEDAQMLESRRFSVEEICRFFGVPPHMVGHTENSTSWGTGLEQQTLGFQKFTLRRRLKRIEQALEKQLLTPSDRAKGIRIEFALEGLLRGDSAARSAFYASALQNGWMTINETRALENLPPVEGGEIPRMQMQNVPITEAGNDPDA